MEGGRGLEQTLQGLCGVSLSGHIQTHLEMSLCHLLQVTLP